MLRSAPTGLMTAESARGVPDERVVMAEDGHVSVNVVDVSDGDEIEDDLGQRMTVFMIIVTGAMREAGAEACTDRADKSH